MKPGSSTPHSQGLRPCVMFLNKDDFYNVRLLASRQTPKLEDHSWSAVHDFLFNIFTVNLYICRPTPPSATQGTRHSVVTGTHRRIIIILILLFHHWYISILFRTSPHVFIQWPVMFYLIYIYLKKWLNYLVFYQNAINNRNSTFCDKCNRRLMLGILRGAVTLCR